MLARAFRLNKKAVPFVFKRGVRMHTSFFSVIAQPRYAAVPRFTVVVNNKSVGSAPKRALIKRRLRAMIKVVFLTSFISQYDCIFLAKPIAEKANWAELVDAGRAIFARLHHLAASTDDSALSKTDIARS